MRGSIVLMMVLFYSIVAPAELFFFAKYREDGQGHRYLVDEGETHRRSFETPYLEELYPAELVEHEPIRSSQVVEILSRDQNLIHEILHSRGVVTLSRPQSFDEIDEVVTLIESGPSENRIDLVLMGDGYTLAERTKFMEDMQRIVDHLFREKTFRSYLPLFNVHLVFRASKESGIGKNGVAKNTAYRLARDGETLRAIFPNNPRAIRESCSKAPACDFPIVIANDPYYGGLGGEFAISTSSLTSGAIVLRHELGHNFGRVGEEYDGGGYSGANFSPSESPQWAHWIEGGKSRPEPAHALHLAWPWRRLREGSYKATWNSSSSSTRYQITFSASGMVHLEDLVVMLDGQRLPIDPPNTPDRTFFTIESPSGFGAGAHELTFAKGSTDGDPWLSSIAIYEFGPSFHHDQGFIGTFPLFHQLGFEEGFRPTYETCLMRNMLSERFCPICQENIWIKFLSKMELIDGLSVDRSSELVSVNLSVISIGQFRSGGALEGEHLDIRWYQNENEREDLQGRLQWSLPTKDFQGNWKVRVVYNTLEVRRDDEFRLHSERSFR